MFSLFEVVTKRRLSYKMMERLVIPFVGLLIALPASAVLLVALRNLRAQYLASTFYSGPR